MSFKHDNLKKDENELDRPRSVATFNPHVEDQMQVLIHLLMRAKEKKLDVLGIVWEDTDQGKSAYCDYFDLPRQEVLDMLKQLERIVTLS